MVWEGWPEEREGTVSSIDVAPEFQRQGIATAMWNHAKRLSQSNPSIPTPIHSDFRTPEGDAWAKSTGDWLPPNEWEE